MEHPCFTKGCRNGCPYGAHFYECPDWIAWAAAQNRGQVDYEEEDEQEDDW